ncbi:MAG: manganese catalase family protein [Clostridia bacterium]|nr:manganese catalase family protein [Clostridia bacterium]
MVKPIRVNEPYPIIEDVFCDKYSATVISPAYCGLHGELNAVLSYTRGNFNYADAVDEKTSELFMGIALAEMHHFNLLGQTLLSLGARPNLAECSPFTSSDNLKQKTTLSRAPEKILADSIAMEMVVIYGYEKMLKLLKNRQVYAIIERILEDERLHLEILKDRFNSGGVKIFY